VLYWLILRPSRDFAARSYIDDPLTLRGVVPRMCVDALDATFGRAAVYWEAFVVSETLFMLLQRVAEGQIITMDRLQVLRK
jgi:hypothetical protein